ncbi:sacsin N-terminal ATP-binding-like domain-containing protein [Dyadobacter frigoris]|uniref:ATP-binding protein n=1 Tax=Dyadobacter frigoris TaxID=2576211 RepID=A0A4U6D927_9BACT|nr:ATP-binding protein [Dyadobacter frigoris]TKT92638.1 ATP-binding protein [Dyadobacter frigoris]
MRDNTTQLKSNWKSNDLILIATLTKSKDQSHGYFHSFKNPLSKAKLFYPTIENISVEDKRISFYWGDVQTLNDGDSYLVELEFTNQPKGRNNPYSLKIKAVNPLSQEIDPQINSIESIYYGCYRSVNDRYAEFIFVMSADSGEILLRNKEPLNVFVDPKISLSENNYYSFSIKENIGKLPSAVSHSIKKLEVNPYKDFIRLRFERLSNPEANKMIANLMREIGKGMYSSKQRMIFELLQNADDAPGREKVEFHIDIKGDYFFIMHDGALFNQNDVEAITSAAESTKRGDNKKTGYKGIGFKSVFTDSTEVWVKSGGYQFAFLRNSSIFEDFDNFYFAGERYRKYPELLEEDKLKFKNQKTRFNGSTDIPWQVIPIWQSHLPEDFNDSNFNNFNNPVQFALKLGETNIDEYKVAIDNIAKRPQFLLFLRNISKFRSPKNGVTVFRNDIDDVAEITKSRKGEKNEVYYYTKRIFDNIEVSDISFSQSNIGLKKQHKINDYNEVTYYFTDLEGREIETIPPKLASVDETEISFGILLEENEIIPERDYANGVAKYSSLFTYLPMEDTRFQLPFLINADFVPSSDRQKIQGDNLWNKFIMLKVADNHVATISYYASEFVRDNRSFNSYLSLLLRNLLPEDDTAQVIIDSYNERYLERLELECTVVNDRNEIQLISETIIDTSGLVKLFGHEVFYEIVQTQKYLPHPNLDTRYIRDCEYLNLETIDLEKLAEHVTPIICERLGRIIAEKSLFERPELLGWLEKLAGFVPEYFSKIPFVVHNGELLSLEVLVNEEEAWIMTVNTATYENLFQHLGYHTVNLNFANYTNINGVIRSLNGYVNDKTLTYERIAANGNLSNMPISTKLMLIDFFQNAPFMDGIGVSRYFGQLTLFVDSKGTPRPLHQLISFEEVLNNTVIRDFIISKVEYNALPDSLKKQLISKQDVFTKFILNKSLFSEWNVQFKEESIQQYIQFLKESFSWRNEDVDISQSQWALIPWLYINDETRFLECDGVFWSRAFQSISSINYDNLGGILGRMYPVLDCKEIINLFSLKMDSQPFDNWESLKNLDITSANILLDWMEADGSYSDFFFKYTFISTSENKWSIVPIGNKQVFDSSETFLKSYINSIEGLKGLFQELDLELCSETRSKIGLLRDHALLKSIIETKLYDQNFASYLPRNADWKVFRKFIENLPELKLGLDFEYSASSPEHIIVNNILRVVEGPDTTDPDVQFVIDDLRNKIKIGNSSLSDFDLSNNVYIGKGDGKKILKLSDILEEFKGESDILDKLIVSFFEITDKTKLRKLIFKTRSLPINEICSRIESESRGYYTEYQVVFQILYRSVNSGCKWSKMHFDNYFQNQKNLISLFSSYKRFLDIIHDIDLVDLNGFSFIDFDLRNCVQKDWAISSEILPHWLQEWIELDVEKRIHFISQLGYNEFESSIVKLRREVISENYDRVKVDHYYDESRKNHQLIWNTNIWLAKFSSEIITRSIDLIRLINNQVSFNKGSITSLTIPIIGGINEDGRRTYKFINVKLDRKLLILKLDQELSFEIFQALSKRDHQVLIVDDTCGKQISHFKTETIKVTSSIDTERLEGKSKLWNEPFYEEWIEHRNYPIFLYDGGEIPFRMMYDNLDIKAFTKDLKITYGGKYYFSNLLRSDLMRYLSNVFPKNALQSLEKWELETRRDPSILEKPQFTYNETFDRMIQDRFGISSEKQKDENDNAKVHVLYYLSEQGYKVSEGESGLKYSALYDIIDSNGNKITCIVRSARGGLLYLDKEHWDMLEDLYTYLAVVYPGNSVRLFKDRIDLLNDDLSKNVLFRVSNNKQESKMDDVFDSLESDAHMILVTSEKMRESLFSKLKKSSIRIEESDIAVSDDDFKL